MNEHPSTRLSRWVLAAILALFIGAIAVAGYWYFKTQEKDLVQKASDELGAIADLKVEQIARWYRERRGDAEILLHAPMIADEVSRFLANPTEEPTRQNLLTWMETIQTFNRYNLVALYDAHAVMRLSVPSGRAPSEVQLVDQVQRALKSKEILIEDLNRSQPNQPIRLNLLVPVGIKPEISQAAEGVLVLEVNPYEFLFPLVQNWPTPSRTAETLLVRREGNEVVYLNELRHRKNTALTLRLPIDPLRRLPAAMALTGQEGVVEGSDYRGVPVLAATRRVAGTPWFMVAKVDQEEIYAPLRERARAATMFAGALMLAAVLGIGLVWRQRELTFTRLQLADERMRQALTELVLYLTKQANDIILLFDREFRILEANDSALRAYGYSLPELQNLTIHNLRAPDAGVELRQQIGRLQSEGKGVIETVHQRKDGSLFDVEASIHSVTIEGSTFFQGIIRDVTERKRAEEAQRASAAYARSLIEASLDPLVTISPEGKITDVNEASVQSTGVSREKLIGTDFSDYFTQPEKAREGYRRVFSEGIVRDYPLAIRHVSGRVTDVLYNATVYRDAQGQVVGVFAAARDVTERKRGEEKLHQEEERFRLVAECSTDLIYEWDIGSRIQWFGKVDELMGYAPGEFPRTLEGWADLLHTEDRERVMAAVDRQLKGEARYDIEYRIRKKDGTYGYWWARGIILLDVARQPYRWIGTVTDITKRKEADRALQQSESKYRRLHESMMDAFVRVDLNGRIVEFNNAYLNMLGYPPDELRTLTYQELTPERWHAFEAGIVEEQIMKRGYSDVYEKEYRRKDGTELPVELRAFLLRDSAGKPVNIWGIARDISPRKAMEAALRESEERFRRALIDSPFPILLHAEDGTILHASNSWFEITGYTREELVTIADWTERAYGERREQIQPNIDTLYRLDHRKAEGDYHIRTKDGTIRIWDFSSAPLGRLPDGRRLVLSMAMDVTERREAENAVRRLNTELEQRIRDRTSQLESANKELEAFSYSVSHDLRAPLRAIDGFARILTEEHAERLDGEGRRVLDVICNQTKRMGQLIDDLLAFSRMGRREKDLTDIDMTALAQAVLEEAAAHAPGRELHWTIRPLPPARGDRVMIGQVWTNLLFNAVKFTKSRKDAAIEIGGSTKDGECVYSVRDNGVGFDMKYSDKLFGVFQRLHSQDEFEGTGVGLALVQRIILRHGGRVWAEGKVDGGATFYFALPFKQAET